MVPNEINRSRDNKTGRFIPGSVSRCPTCHPDRKYCARGLCETCYKRARFQSNPALRERNRQNQRALRRKYPARYRAYGQKKYGKQNARLEVYRHLRRMWSAHAKYGLTPENYTRLLEIQRYCCAMCSRPFRTEQPRSMGVDHDHRTGRVRGLLCPGCNALLAKFESDVWKSRVAAYLQDPPAKEMK